MDKHIITQHKGKHVVITLKPNSFIIDGIIKEIYEESFSFETAGMTSYVNFDNVSFLRLKV